MTTLSPAVTKTLEAQKDAMASKINVALLGQQLDAQQEIGDAINQMVKQVVDVQKQLANGHIDVRV